MTVIVPIENGMFYVNRRLAALLARSTGDAVEVPLGFRFLARSLKRVEDCVFFHELAIGLNHLSRPITGTEYEASVNLIRIKDYAEPEYLTTLEGVARTTLLCAEYLVDRLRTFSPDDRFRVIVSTREDDGSARLGFHTIRDDESWLDDDLEGYQEEGIGYIDT
jgi:hypothetical protein